MYNIYTIVILILFDIPRFSVNDLHQIQVAAPSPSSRKSTFDLTVYLFDIIGIRVISGWMKVLARKSMLLIRGTMAQHDRE